MEANVIQTPFHKQNKRYEYAASYFKAVCENILEFKDSLGVEEGQLLGIGFAMQALISPDRQKVLYGEILSCTGLSIEEFTRHLPYPCAFIHDADSAAVSEMWESPELSDAFYLSLSRHLGAAVKIGRASCRERV